MTQRILLESGSPDGYLLENGSGVLLLEEATIASSFTANAVIVGRFTADAFILGHFSADAVIKRTWADSLTIALRDDFDRSVTDGFGTADIGGAYARNGGTDANFSVAAGVASIVIPITGTFQRQLVASSGVTPSRISCALTFSFAALASSLEAVFASLRFNASVSLELGLRIDSAGAVSSEVRGEVNATQVLSPAQTYVAGEIWRMQGVWDGASGSVGVRATKVGVAENAPTVNTALGAVVGAMRGGVTGWLIGASPTTVSVYDVAIWAGEGFTANAFIPGHFSADASIVKTTSSSFTARAVLQATIVGRGQPQLVGVATATTATSSLDFTVPATVVAGDSLLVFAGSALGSGPTYSAAPAGWTLADSTDPSATIVGAASYQKVAVDADAGASVSFSMSTSVSQVGRMVAYRDTRASINAASTSGSSASATTASGALFSSKWITKGLVKGNATAFTYAGSAEQLEGQNTGNNLAVATVKAFGLVQYSGAFFTQTETMSWATATSYRGLAFLVALTGNGFTANAFIPGHFTADASIVVTVTGSLTANAVIKRTQTGAATADAVLFKNLTSSFTADATTKRTQSSAFSADAFIARHFNADAKVNRVARPVWTTPGNGATISSTPTLAFTMPVIQSGRKMHFWIELDTASTFDSGNYRSYKSHTDQTSWEYWDGGAWQAVPAAGVSDTYIGNEARLTITNPLSGTWYRRVRAGVI